VGFYRRLSNADLKLKSDGMPPRDYYVYILQCEGGNRYCGWTCHVINRLVAHLTGKGAKFTRGFPPIGLLHLERVGSYMDAIKGERRTKDMMRKKKDIKYHVAKEYQGVFEIIQTELLWHDGPYIKGKLNAIERGG